MYDPADMPTPVRARQPRGRGRSSTRCCASTSSNIEQSSFFQGGQGLGAAMSDAEVAQMRATYYGLMSEIDDQLGRVFD